MRWAVGATVALGGAGVAHAGYLETATNFKANWEFSDFGNADGVVKLNFTKVSGVLEFNIPPPGVWFAERKGTFAWDYNGVPTPVSPILGMAKKCTDLSPDFAGYDACTPTPSFVPVGAAKGSYTDITGTHFVYDWTPTSGRPTVFRTPAATSPRRVVACCCFCPVRLSVTCPSC